MKAHYLQHVSFEGLGAIEPWLIDNDYSITTTRLYENQPLPEIGDINLLIIMGGPMSVNDELLHPWLAEEKEFIRKAINADIPILGICLGAQLIASALGAQIYRNPEKEIGWFSITGLPFFGNTFQFPDQIEAFHWHGETFDLPQKAIHLAKSKVCENQAFQIGRKIIGLQFHLETTQESARLLVENCGNELINGKFIQSAEDILSANKQKYSDANQVMNNVLKYLAACYC